MRNYWVTILVMRDLSQKYNMKICNIWRRWILKAFVLTDYSLPFSKKINPPWRLFWKALGNQASSSSLSLLLPLPPHPHCPVSYRIPMEVSVALWFCTFLEVSCVDIVLPITSRILPPAVVWRIESMGVSWTWVWSSASRSSWWPEQFIWLFFSPVCIAENDKGFFLSGLLVVMHV